MYVLLKVCGSGLGFRVLCVNGNVVSVRENVCIRVGGKWNVMHV